MDEVLAFLAESINKNGPDSLQREPWKVYGAMMKQELDPFQCRLVLTSLLAGACEKAQKTDAEHLAAFLQKSCGLRKKPAEELAAMYADLFSAGRRSAWDANQDEGFREFCSETWEYKWDGEGAWHRGGGHYDCSSSITLTFSVADPAKTRKVVEKVLERNPFTSAEKIFDHLSKILDGELDEEMEDYVTAEPYYPPVMEEFDENAEDVIQKFCEKTGLKYTDFNCEGDMSDFESDDYRW